MHEDCDLRQLAFSQTGNLHVTAASKRLAQPLGSCPKHITVENQLLIRLIPIRYSSLILTAKFWKSVFFPLH